VTKGWILGCRVLVGVYGHERVKEWQYAWEMRILSNLLIPLRRPITLNARNCLTTNLEIQERCEFFLLTPTQS
jgi:hypothetical protein